MILKEIDYKHPTDYENATHVEIPSEELYQDGELQPNEVMDNIHYHVMIKGDWILVGKIDK